MESVLSKKRQRSTEQKQKFKLSFSGRVSRIELKAREWGETISELERGSY